MFNDDYGIYFLPISAQTAIKITHLRTGLSFPISYSKELQLILFWKTKEQPKMLESKFSNAASSQDMNTFWKSKEETATFAKSKGVDALYLNTKYM